MVSKYLIPLAHRAQENQNYCSMINCLYIYCCLGYFSQENKASYLELIMTLGKFQPLVEVTWWF